MPTPQELEHKLWKALKSDRTLMLGLDGVDDGHTRPMTAIVEDEDVRGPIWIFTATNNDLVRRLSGNQHRVIGAFASKDHQVFASIHGELSVSNDRAVVERLWNPFIAAWYEGKDDPRLVLLRLDAEHAEVWLNENSFVAGIKMLLGVDPKKDYKDHVADVPMNGQRRST